MNQPLLSFTPSALPKETLEELFVAREPLLARLEASVDHLAAGAAHHTLLVGPRGIGKTHLTSMLYHRVKARNSFAVAWLREDPWGLRSYEQLVDQLGDAVRREDGAAVVGRHNDRVSAEASLIEAVGDRKLLVLIENFVDVLTRIKRDGQLALRALLQNSGSILLVATSPSLGSDVTKQAAPFYGFFDTVRLEELTLDEASALLVKVAALRGDQALVEFLSTDTAQRRLKVVEALAGGHPRVWMLLANCMSIETIDELVPVFLKALDDLTPYYQDRMRELPQQQESIVFELCEHRLPLTVGEIARRCGLLQNAASVQIRELVDKGYLRKIQTSGGDRRKAYYELREPLMRICLDVKESRGEPLRLIVEFLRDWYGMDLLNRRLDLPLELVLAHQYVDSAISAWAQQTLKVDLEALQEMAQSGHYALLDKIGSGAVEVPPQARVGALLLLGDLPGAVSALDAVGDETSHDRASIHHVLELIGPYVATVGDVTKEGAAAVLVGTALVEGPMEFAIALAAFYRRGDAFIAAALALCVPLLVAGLVPESLSRVSQIVHASAEGMPSVQSVDQLLRAGTELASGDLTAHLTLSSELRPALDELINMMSDESKRHDLDAAVSEVRDQTRAALVEVGEVIGHLDAAMATRVSQKATPPPQSVRVSLVSELATGPSAAPPAC